METTHADSIDEVVVTAQRSPQPRLRHTGNIAQISTSELKRDQHVHAAEMLGRASGAWAVRGSGQEQQLAIRSPVLTGGGSCAGFLVLEDGIPVRPAGFCNANLLIEVNTEQATAIEILRGPGSALHGSNAVHGVINVLMPDSTTANRSGFALERGPNDFVRGRFSHDFGQDSNWHASGIYANDGGFRSDSGYHQAKMHISRAGHWLHGDLRVSFTATQLDQETAGFIYGREAYRDAALSRKNLDPEAFRNAESQRLYATWNRKAGSVTIDIRPYFRRTDMQFMHHAQPGQPIEENGHNSAGFISTASFEKGGFQTVIGMDAERAGIFLRQTQEGPADGGRLARETRPAGRHYDYEVDATNLAGYVQSGWQFNERLRFDAGLRADYMRYSYDNLMLDGNTREDGTACGFGGCLFSRPADRSDDFFNLAHNLSAGFTIDAHRLAFLRLSRGFRAPQALELYRLQNGQSVADLESERIDSLELGLRTSYPAWSGELVLFAMRKRDSVFRDAEGFNVSGARSRHHGVEASLETRLGADWRLAASMSHARHRYDFDYLEGRGERFVAGNEMDTAPRWTGQAELMYEPDGPLQLGLQWVYTGRYYLDSLNLHDYPGHRLLNLRANWRLSEQTQLSLRLKNLTDRRYADRADFGGGDYRYLPGRGRELFVEYRQHFRNR